MAVSIMRSITDNNSQRLSKLLRYGAGLKITPDDLANALIAAIRQSREECVTSLLNAGGDANSSDDEGRPAMFVCMEYGRGNPQILKSLLRAGANPNKVTWSAQQTALHAAARKGYQVCIKQLLLAGAHVNKQDSTGYTALMYAAREGHITILRSLIAEKANINMVNNNHESALHLSVRGHHSHCVDELLCQQADPSLVDIRGQSALLIAIREGYEELIDILLDNKAAVNAQDKITGKTILHLAIVMQNVPLIIKLLDMKADPNVRDKEWQTPFLLALNMSRRDIMEHLLKAGCKITTTDRSFNTPLHIASINGQADMIHLFIERGLDVNLKGSGGMTPIMLASFGAHCKTVQILLQYGANNSLTDRNHASALVYAILSKEPIKHIHDVVKVLIKSNCDINKAANLSKIIRSFSIQIDEGIQVEQRLYSPLELAFLRGDSAIFMMLLRAGCDTTTFHCDKDITLQNFQSVHSDLKNRWYLLRSLKSEKNKIKSLKALCRKPLLKSFGKMAEMTINSLPISEQLKQFLKFADVDEVCQQYTGNSPTILASPSGNKSPRATPFTSPFSRNTKARATIAGTGRQRSFSYDQSKPCLPRASWDSNIKKPVKAKTPKPRSNSVIASSVTDSFLDKRRIISMSSTSQLAESTADEEIVDRPKIGLFKYMKSKVTGSKDKDKQQVSKARSKRARDPRETINLLLHGSSEEYMSSGEITPRPLNMASIEALNDIDKSPQEDYASVNQLLYGKSLRTPDSEKEDIAERIRSLRKERLSQIDAGGVEEYINQNGDESTQLDDVFDFNMKMEALTKETTNNDNVLKRSVSLHGTPRVVNNNNNCYPNGEPVSPESSPNIPRKPTNLDNINSLLFGKQSKQQSRNNSRHPITSHSEPQSPMDNGIDKGIGTKYNTSRNGFAKVATGRHNKPPSVDISNTASSNSPSLLSPPTSTADSCDSSGSSGHMTFTSGDPQLMHKYLASQDAPLNGKLHEAVTPKQRVAFNHDLNGNANEHTPEYLDQKYFNMNNGRQRTSSISSIESTGSRRSCGTAGSKIPVLRFGWSPLSASKTKIPMPVTPIIPSSRGFGNFVRSKSVRKW